MEKEIIRVTSETKKKLRNCGTKRETDEDIIKNLLELYYEKYGDIQQKLSGFHKYPKEEED